MASLTPDLSIVLPAHDEAENIAPMAAALKNVLAPLCRFEIVFVDDGSTDGTLSAIRAAAAADRNIRFISFTRNFGHEAALRAGLRHARGGVVVVMDADFEHPPELIPDLLREWQRGNKIVTAQRSDDETTSGFRRLSSRLYYRLLGALGDVRMEPGSANFILMDRMVVDALNRFDDHDFFLRGVVRWLGYPLASVPYRRGRREHGASKYSLRRMVELALTGITAHSIRPLRFAIWLSLAFAGVGLLLVIYSVISFFFVTRTVAGWTSIMAALALLGAAQLLVLGIIGEYVGRILRETRRRPAYVVAETEADSLGAAEMPRLPRRAEPAV
jgi:dolichol-phosphate mannosyltransferase